MKYDLSHHIGMKAYVIPAFEVLKENDEIPLEKEQLRQMTLENRTVPFHFLIYQPGHSVTSLIHSLCV